MVEEVGCVLCGCGGAGVASLGVHGHGTATSITLGVVVTTATYPHMIIYLSIRLEVRLWVMWVGLRGRCGGWELAIRRMVIGGHFEKGQLGRPLALRTRSIRGAPVGSCTCVADVPLCTWVRC